MTPPPERIVTERLVLRAWRADDAPALARAMAANVPHLARWMPWASGEPATPEVCAARIAGFLARVATGDTFLYALLDPTEREVLGGGGIHLRGDGDAAPDRVELGYWIAAPAERRGYVTEAVRALVPHARALAAARMPHAPHVEIRCDARNAASAAVARRAGFRHVRTIRGQHVQGALRDTLVLRLPTAPDAAPDAPPDAPPVLPTIDTARLRLRPARDGDVDALWRLWTDPDVRRYLWDDRAIERDEAAGTVHALGELAGRGLGLWCLERIGSDAALVGCAGLLPVDAAAAVEPSLAGMVEPLVALAPDAWGRGLATEALDALVLHAFAVLELPALAGVTDVPNAASDRMLRRAGFVAFAERPGPRYPLRLYRLERPDEDAPTVP